MDICYAQEKVIFDTDIGPDWDDVGATAVLHALANSGEAEILAMMVSSGGHSGLWGPPCLDAFNTYYGRPDIPIGVAEDGPSFGSRYNQQIAEEFEQDLGTDNAWDAVELYRKVLSEQPDSSVVIVTVGFITNIADLLNSESDSNSPLNGMDLVHKKVKRWVCMGGGYPSSGGEFNFNRDAVATQFAVENWPKPALFSGYEIGAPIQTGAKLALTSETNPIRRAYELAGGYVGVTRSSWDQTAVLAAIRDPLLYWDLETSGYCHVFNNGSNEWRTSPDKDHSYLIRRVPDEEMKEIIDNLMADIEGLPEVSITSPAYGASFDEGADITVVADALDTNGQVVQVEFFAREIKIGEANTAPYSAVWSNVARGGYYLTARVTDDDGHSMYSDPVKIYIGDLDHTFVGHWMFENNAVDSSDHANNGNISGTPEFVNALSQGKALHFKTSQDFITIPKSPDFSITSFTLAAWVKIPGPIPEGWRTIIEHNRDGRNWFGLWKSANGDMFHFRWTNNGTAKVDFSSNISPNSWYHVAATFNAIERTARLYLNGRLDKVIQNTDVPEPVDSEMRIGINMDNMEEFNGIIDDVRVYNRVLDESEINGVLTETSAENNNELLPDRIILLNYPNPFNPSTTIYYSMPVRSHVKIDVYDIGGQHIAILVDEEKMAGTHTIQFTGNEFSSGVYFYRLQTERYKAVNKMLYVK
ncbi:nucleoside hydrolase [candidate division KSB1 bacterium]|nr:nucleoside hydrolase [candidate division KSB1 bacterium]